MTLIGYFLKVHW